MGQFIKNILLFSIFLVGVYMSSLLVIKFTGTKYITPNIISTQGSSGNNLERFNEIDNYSDVDYLFLGSSHAYRGFDPRTFKKHGYTSFNLGSSSQPPYNSYYLLKQYLHKLQPKTILIEVYWGGLIAEKDAIETTVDIVSNKSLSLTDVEMTALQHHPIAINTLCYSWVSNFITPLSKVEQDKNGYDTYVAGGFVERTDTTGIKSKMAKISGSTDIEYNSFQMGYLAKIAQLCNDNGIRLILVRTPVTVEKINTVKNFDELNQELIQFSKIHNTQYLDFCTEEAFNTIGLVTVEDFYDGHHMNQSGIEKFNDFLIVKLKSL